MASQITTNTLLIFPRVKLQISKILLQLFLKDPAKTQENTLSMSDKQILYDGIYIYSNCFLHFHSCFLHLIRNVKLHSEKANSQCNFTFQMRCSVSLKTYRKQLPWFTQSQANKTKRERDLQTTVCVWINDEAQRDTT